MSESTNLNTELILKPSAFQAVGMTDRQYRIYYRSFLPNSHDQSCRSVTTTNQPDSESPDLCDSVT